MKKYQANISVIVPMYNSEKYIENCLKSILSQSYKDFEVITIDDGSIDNTGCIVKKIAQSDNRIRYINKQNEGVSKTRNLGIALSRGTFIAFVDADDWIEKDFFENAIEFIKEFNLDLILGGTVKVYNSKNEICSVDNKKSIWIYEDNLKLFESKVLGNYSASAKELNRCFTSGPVCKLFKKTAIQNVRFKENLVLGEDTVFNLEVLSNVKRIGVVPLIWYYYCMNDYSATHRIRENVNEESCLLLKEMSLLCKDKEYLKPYLWARAIQQFHGMLILYSLHEKTNWKLKRQARYITNCLNEDIWSRIFNECELSKLSVSKFDKLLAIFCKKKCSLLIIFLVKGRKILKKVLSKLKG